LDLGAGYCSFINNICAADKHALDIYPEFSRNASPGVHCHVGPGDDLALFPTERFDVVFTSNLLEHLTRESTLRVLQGVRRILKTGGRFIIVQPNFYYSFRNYFDDYTHIQIFTHTGLADLLTANGYRVEKMEPRFLPFSFKSRLPTWSWLVALYLKLPVRPFAGQMLLVARPVK
jgi:SAM-dependent methyltransferase